MKWLAGIRRWLKCKLLPPPLSEWQVAEFERAQGIRLPEDYREYLLKVAGAPPGNAHGYSLHDCLGEHAKYGDFLQSPFPHSEDCNEMDGDDKQVAGSLLLAFEGCTYYLRLVVTGPMRGTVWEDSRGSDCGLAPMKNAAGMPMTFKEWIAKVLW